ncbi:MAG: ELWxxDGT repeat protein, partial [Candidatus Poseidoniaceae archaeon]
MMVKDINTGTQSSGNSNPSDFTVVGNTLYFTAFDGNTVELWKSDGTTAGTMMVKDINPVGQSTSLDHLTAVGNTLFFQADDGVNGKALWKSDGTASGTVMVHDIHPGSDDTLDELTAVGNILYFRCNDGINGLELWKSDGTSSGTVMVKDINTQTGATIGSSIPSELTAIGNTLFFRA